MFSLPRKGAALAVSALFFVTASPFVAALDVISVDAGQPHQTIEGFGTSIAAFQNQSVIDTLYDDDFRNTWVNDLGCTVLRIDLWHDTLTTPIANVEDITWDKFSNHGITKTSVDFALAVHAKNPEVRVIASAWSPPAWMKENNSARGETALPNKLREDREDHFARYVAQYCLWWRDHWELPLYGVSIQNEPMFDEPYGSCVYDKVQYGRVLAKVCAELIAAGLTDIKVFGPEHMTSDSPNSKAMLEAAIAYPEVKQMLWASAGHGYVDGVQADQNPLSADRFWTDIALSNEVRYWMTETSGEAKTWEDYSAAYPGALNGMAGKIHQSLTGGNASLYAYWQITDPIKDVFTDDVYTMMNLKVPHKKYYAAKHYYKFIRPGAVRVNTSPVSINKVDTSAFLHEEDDKLTIVILNRDTVERALELNVTPLANLGTFQAYRSSETENFEQIADVTASNSVLSVTLPARSMITLHGGAAGLTVPELPALADTVFLSSTGEAQPLAIGGESFSKWGIYKRSPWVQPNPAETVSGDSTLMVGAQRNRAANSRTSWIKVGPHRVNVVQGGASLFESSDLGFGWRITPLGFIWDNLAPFYYHATWGWCYAFPGGEPDGFFMYRFTNADFIFYAAQGPYYYAYTEAGGWTIETAE